MKRIIILFVLLISFFCSYSQVFVNRSGPAVTAQDDKLAAKNAFYLPRLTDTAFVSGALDSIGLLIYDRLRAKIWKRDTVLTGGHKWNSIGENISNASLTADGTYSQNWNNKQLIFDSIATYFQFKSGGIGSGGTRRKEFRIVWGGSSFGNNLDGFQMLASVRKADNSADSLTLGLMSSGTGVLSMGTYNVANSANNTFISYNANAGLINITAKDSIWIRGAIPAATADTILGLEDRGNGLSKLKKIPIPIGDIVGSGTNGQLTYWTGTKTISGNSGALYDPTQHKITTDSLLVNSKGHLRFLSDSTTEQPEILFSPISTPEDSAMEFRMTLDAARVNPLSTRQNWVFSMGFLQRKFVNDGYMRIGMESHYGQFGTYNYEIHLPEVMLPNSTVIRPISIIIPKTNNPFIQMLHNASTYIYDNALSTKNYASFATDRDQLLNHLNSDSTGMGTHEFQTFTDGGTAIGGFKMQSFFSGTVSQNFWTMYAKRWEIATPGGLFINSTGTPNGSGSPFHFNFNQDNSASGDVFIFLSGWGSTYQQNMCGLKNGHVQITPINENDHGQKLQVAQTGDSVALLLTDNDKQTTVNYPITLRHTYNGGGIQAHNGFGVGIPFELETDQSNILKVVASIHSAFTDSSAGTEDADLIFKNVQNGTLTQSLKIGVNGSMITYGRRYIAIITSSAGTLTIDNAQCYIFNGTTTTWTLPPVSGTTGLTYILKNIGSGSITLNADSGNNEIYSTSAVNTYTITAGSSITLISNGTYFTVN